MLTDPGQVAIEANPQAPDPSTAQARIAAFEQQHGAALTDPNTWNRRELLAERSKLYAAAHGADPEPGPVDVSSADANPGEPTDPAVAIGRVLERHWGAQGEEGAAFAADLAAAGIGAAEMAGLAHEIRSGSPLPDGQLVSRLGPSTLREAAAFLEANPQLDELLGERELWRYPCVLRECARRFNEHK